MDRTDCLHVNTNGRQPTIAIDSNDTIHLAWWTQYETAGEYGEIAYCKHDTEWSTPENVGAKDRFQLYPAIAVDSQNNVHVVWQGWGYSPDPARCQIIYRKRTQAGWQDVEQVTENDFWQYRPSIAVDKNDNVHIVWDGTNWGTNTANSNIRYRMRTALGWGDHKAITDKDADQFVPCVSVSPDNDVHITWHGMGWGANTAYRNIQYRQLAYTPIADTYLYNEGVGGDDWVVGYIKATGGMLKRASYIELYALNSGATAEGTVVTDALVDLTDVNTIHIDWLNNGNASDDNESYLVVSTNKTDSHATYDARLAKVNTFTRTTDTLDVSGLTGDHYIRVHARDANATAQVVSGVYMYKLWLEHDQHTLEPQEAVTDVDYHQYGGTNAVDGSGNVHVAWYGLGWGNNPTVTNIQYCRKRKVWGAIIPLTDRKVDQYYPSLLADHSLAGYGLVWGGVGLAGPHTGWFPPETSDLWYYGEWATPYPEGAWTVYLGGKHYQKVKGSLSIDRRLEQRSTARFTVIDKDGTASFSKGTPVEIYDADMILIFAGFVHKPESIRMAPKYGLLHSLLCVDNHYLADKRLMTESYAKGTKAGDIFRDVVQKYLASEYVSIGEIQDGPELEESVFNHVNISDAFDAIKETSGAFVWYIDELRRLHFVDRTTFTTLWPLDSTIYRPLQGSTHLDMGNDQHRNMQYIWGGFALTDPRTETFTGDGSTRTFLLQFAPAETPSIEENSVVATVGIKGIDEGFDYYWTKGDPVIYADVAPPLGHPVEITYRGHYPFIARDLDDQDIVARAKAETSSGLVEDIVREAHDSRESARQSARAKIAQYCQDAERFVYRTHAARLRPGQLQEVTFAPFGFDKHEMLIEAVRTMADGNLVTHEITCITGPILGDWTQFFGRLLKRQDRAIMVGGDLMLKQFDEPESLDLSESLDLRDFDFTGGILGMWVTLADQLWMGYHVQHERLDLAESDDLNEFDTEEYYYVPAPAGKQDGRWNFSTWA